MALSWIAGSADDVAQFESSRFAATYRQLNSAVYGRTLEAIRALLSKWRIDEPGLIPLSEWISVEQWRANEGGIEEAPLDLYGVLVTKE